jgi:AraC family ethanolamine operon transcriptional activator
VRGFASAQKRNLESFEELNDAVRGAHKQVVQTGRGRINGYMAHLSIGGLPVDIGAFSVGMRSIGILSDDRMTIGMLTGRTDKVTQWSRDVNPGDVLVTPPGEENERQYRGGASYAVISLSAADIRANFGSEPRLRELDSWRRGHFRPAFRSNNRALLRLTAICARLQNEAATLTEEAAEFWKKSIIEAMTAAMLVDIPCDDVGPAVSGRKIVRRVEDYLSRTEVASVHISEICCELNVSRRTLHRLFHNELGIGPVTYLQRRRLCCVHTALRSSDPATTTIAEIALQHGFLNLGRFSGYYRSHFDEYPSETFGKSLSA